MKDIASLLGWIRTRPRYRWRSWCRWRIPQVFIDVLLGGDVWLRDPHPQWRISVVAQARRLTVRLFPLGHDCRQHAWSNYDNEVERCDYCRAVRPIRPEWRDPEANMRQVAAQAAGLVQETGVSSEALHASERAQLSSSDFRSKVDRNLAEHGCDRFSQAGERIAIAAFIEAYVRGDGEVDL